MESNSFFLALEFHKQKSDFHHHEMKLFWNIGNELQTRNENVKLQLFILFIYDIRESNCFQVSEMQYIDII